MEAITSHTQFDSCLWQELPAVVLLNVVRLLRDLHDRAAVSSVCRFWRAVTYYWTDVHEIIINHSYFDEDYFKCAINADGRHVQVIRMTRLFIKEDIPFCIHSFFERFISLNKVTLIACDLRTHLIRVLKYSSRKPHSLIITDECKGTHFDRLPDPVALYNRGVDECLLDVQMNWSALPSSCTVTVNYACMWLCRIRLIFAVLPPSIRYMRLVDCRQAGRSISQRERQVEQLRQILDDAVPAYHRLTVDVGGDFAERFERSPIFARGELCNWEVIVR
ncbi:hypothetical protein Tcan_11046 [Toxocara canis]|uniref:F-box domain-containing protein n=1 Tax=Toxocara canis TaxID=6265 RepID=A0A0B2UVX6_TOXCA|nr:hypothetical protein Tcan_11046 [Toxocara canis]